MTEFLFYFLLRQKIKQKKISASIPSKEDLFKKKTKLYDVKISCTTEINFVWNLF